MSSLTVNPWCMMREGASPETEDGDMDMVAAAESGTEPATESIFADNGADEETETKRHTRYLDSQVNDVSDEEYWNEVHFGDPTRELRGVRRRLERLHDVWEKRYEEAVASGDQ